MPDIASNELKKIKLFFGLPQDQLQKLNQIVSRQKHVKNKLLFRTGEKSLGFFCILSGQVRVFKAALSGKEHTLHQLGPGDSFAEVVAFAGSSYPANAETLSCCELIFVPRTKLRDLIASDPELAMSMLSLLSSRLIGFVHKIEQLSLKEVPARLASHFLLLSGKGDSFKLDMPKGRLASYLGSSPETVSRSLNKMSEQGLISLQGKKGHILDYEGLEQLALGRS